MTEQSDERWVDEGGHLPPEHSPAWFLREIAVADAERLEDLWAVAIEQLGDDAASRLWQEAFSGSDASET